MTKSLLRIKPNAGCRDATLLLFLPFLYCQMLIVDFAEKPPVFGDE
jgi:hypothetical protein